MENISVVGKLNAIPALVNDLTISEVKTIWSLVDLLVSDCATITKYSKYILLFSSTGNLGFRFN